MAKPKVFITRLIPDEGIKALKKKGYLVDVYEKDRVIPRQELLKRVQGVDAILSLLTDKIDGAVLDAAGKQLQIVANYAVGFDNIDLPAAKSRHIPVTNTPAPEVSEAVAEHVFALMLGLAHRIVEADKYARAEKYKGWAPNLLLGTDLHGKTLGIVGLGHIGTAVAKRAVNGFGMKCLYTDLKPNKAFEKEFGAKFVKKEVLLKKADFITLHIPLFPSTRHYLSTKEFNLMKKTAFIVNTSRGPVVDEKALLKALKAKKIASAGIDVYECEPAIDCDIRDNLELKSFDTVILTPHIASGTIEARQAMSLLAAKNIIAVLSGKKPLTPAK
ncbi:D-glycerate dehydrogenase [Candidatus Uhrbacteria bacterium CG22_combo_CG10-13_8_21_14_all_47_17]|uniref:D-glycerate dehydrogenase n=1 Tax=Candidatus Uhrbacteria bacterium CG22_combo_CG10-13_8_21_14_all_47_17 TaxID=1975041 RepID=A0A2H0BT68_9BACT|nr:MAG: D-glycerate dehydrogenase [Candidatus Uhrbacteria bacterium CG22_combo_CG10-13_8_21_14_all_47_17]